MAARKIRLALVSGSVATAAFYTGKCYERNTFLKEIEQSNERYMSVFGSVLKTPTEVKPSIVPASLFSSFDKVRSFFKKKLSKDLGSLKAASPLPPSVPEINSPTELPDTVDRNPARTREIIKLGLPGLTNLIPFNDFVLSYDNRNRIAHWVLEHLTEESIKANDKVRRNICNFKVDTVHVHPYFRATNMDYGESGYDRGHLAAAGNHKSNQKSIDETFYLSNIAPQVGRGFNRDSWNKLEKYVRKLTKTYQNVYCCTGPLFLPLKEKDGRTYIKYEVIGPNHVAVPTHFFKVVVGQHKNGSLEMECFVMENAEIDPDISLKSFRVAPEVIERSSGLLFFDAVTRQSFKSVNGMEPY